MEESDRGARAMDAPQQQCCCSGAAAAAPDSLWGRVRREVASWRRGTVTIHDVDPWLRFNPYVRRGFRHRGLRKREALASIALYIHNESFNIVSHLLMAVLMALLVVWPPHLPTLLSGAGAAAAATTNNDNSNGGDGGGRGGLLRTNAAFGSSSGAAAHRRDGERVEAPAWLSGSHTTVDAVGDAGAVRHAPPVSLSHTSSSFFFGGAAAAPTPTPLPTTVAARLSLSLAPLVLSLLLTYALSAAYHTFMPCCRSRRGYQQLLQCDVMGVLCSIAGSGLAYVSCGMPCASASTQAAAAALLLVATVLCMYVAVLLPMWSVVVEASGVVVQGGRWAVAAVLSAALELAVGRPLLAAAAPPPPPHARHRTPRPPAAASALPPPGLYADQHAVLAWLHRHRRLSLVLRGGGNGGNGGNGGGEPVPVGVRQRGLVVGAYCLLHLGVYVTLVHPKSRVERGGFTQATGYHIAAYAWLFVGGVINMSRVPEVLVFHWTRRAARHTRRVAAAEAAARCAAQLEMNAAESPPPSSSLLSSSPSAAVAAPTWWDRLCFSRVMVTHVISPVTLDYIGNSHNLWHVCTALSGVSAVLAVYYDCVEYDLVRCS